MGSGFIHEVLHEMPDRANETGLKLYAPFLPTEPLTVDKRWFAPLPVRIQRSLSLEFTNFTQADIQLPHQHDVFLKFDKAICEKFHSWYGRQYEFQYFASLVPDAKLIFMSVEQRQELFDFMDPLLNTREKPNLDGLKLFGNIFEEIDAFLQIHKRIFVKTSQKSAKNQFELYPATTLVEVFDNLVHSSAVAYYLLKSDYLVLRPWNDKIAPNNEFRVFVEGGRIICASQKFFFEPIKQFPDFSGFLKKLNKLVKNLPYSDGVLDVNWIDSEVVLAEVNPGCCWNLSGSSLFKWDEINALRDQGGQPILRLFM